jgi:hypothetical protein
MLTLATTASFFNTTVFKDAYSTATFLGQLLPYADGVRSSPSTPRRILETSSGVSIPARHAIVDQTSGITYIVADYASDSFMTEEVRRKYPITPVSGQYFVRTIAQVLSASGGTADCYVAPSYTRRLDVPDSSFDYANYELTYQKSQTILAGDILYGGGVYYLATQRGRTDDIGFGVVDAVVVESPLSTLSHVGYSGVLNPETDAFTETTVDTVPVFMEHQLLDFVHEALGYKAILPGDRAISFLKSVVTTTRPGDTIGDYKVLAVSDEGASWKVHGRPQ